MIKIDVEIFDGVVEVINKIKAVHDAGIELEIPQGAVLFESALNIKLLEKEAERLGKNIHFRTKDANGVNIIKMINEEEDESFASREMDIDQELFPEPVQQGVKRAISLPKIKLPKFKIRGLKMPGLPKVFPVVLALLVVGGFFGYKTLIKVPKAKIKIVVNSQPLTKSLQIKTVLDGENNPEAKTLKGYAVTASVLKTATIETTGEKIIGEKADGEVRIFNKTSADKTFDDGTVLVFDDEDLTFELTEDVTVPARTEDPVTLVITPGTATAKARALDIGSQYNIDEGEDLDLDDYNSDEFSAKVSEDFDGGKSETVKTVAQEDLDTLSTQVYDEAIAQAETELEKNVPSGKNYIKGSKFVSLANEFFNAEVGEEATEVEITQEVNATGLAYSEDDLDKVFEDLLEELIPDNFVLSSKDQETKVEVLGNTETTELSSSAADLQVTIKTSVVPDIDEGDIKDELAGKSLQEAQSILDNIKNVKNYELEITPSIPFLRQIPTLKENISIDREKNSG